MHDCNCSHEKSPSMKKWMAQGDPLKEVSTVGRHSSLHTLATHYFKKWTASCSVLKKYILLLEKFYASNRSSLTVAILKNYSSQKEN